MQNPTTRGRTRPARMPRMGGGNRGVATTGGAGGAPSATQRATRFLPGFLQPSWMHEVLLELKKVQWPTFQETRNLTMVVLVVAAILGVFLGGLDAGFNWVLEHTLLG